MRVNIRYFAMLREEAGRDREAADSSAETLAALYDELRARYSFSIEAQHMRVAVNGAFVSWSDAFGDGDEVAFIPPVAGG